MPRAEHERARRRCGRGPPTSDADRSTTPHSHRCREPCRRLARDGLRERLAADAAALGPVYWIESCPPAAAAFEGSGSRSAQRAAADRRAVVQDAGLVGGVEAQAHDAGHPAADRAAGDQPALLVDPRQQSAAGARGASPRASAAGPGARARCPRSASVRMPSPCGAGRAAARGGRSTASARRRASGSGSRSACGGRRSGRRPAAGRSRARSSRAAGRASRRATRARAIRSFAGFARRGRDVDAGDGGSPPMASWRSSPIRIRCGWSPTGIRATSFSLA